MVYQSLNAALLEQIPQGVRRVLDVDCGGGAMAVWLKHERGCEVTGITNSLAEAEQARGCLDRVVMADLNTLDPQPLGRFDCIVCSHVLEHLIDAERLLMAFRDALSPEGVLVVALPNVLFWKQRLEFLLGRLRYTDGGLMDRTRRGFGFDFSAASVDRARLNGIDARVLDLDVGIDSAHVPSLAADHVVAFHVLEHLTHPGALFRFADRVAAPSARLWAVVPSDRRMTRVYDEVDVLDAQPHHLTRWTESALRCLGSRFGWRLVSHEYESLREHVRIWEATRRTALYRRIDPPSRALKWFVRRAFAAGVWASGGHRAGSATGFSMLACFRRVASS